MKMDYVITISYSKVKKIRIDAADNEADALRAAITIAQLSNIPLRDATIKIRTASYQKKTTKEQN